MTSKFHNTDGAPDAIHESAEDFTTSEGLRRLLRLLAVAGDDAWRTSPAASHLLAYTQERYLPVARAWHRDPADAAFEAFLAMRSPSVLTADDPWAVVTRAVELGIAAEAHAERLMTSADKARRPSIRPEYEPVRAGHYEEFFYHVLTAAAAEDELAPVRADQVVHSSTTFLVMTGWSARTVETAVEYICHRLTTLSTAQSALDVLRKDQAMRVRLGYSGYAWNGLLRLLIGPRSKKPPTGGDWSRLGIFARLLLGDRARDLLADRRLVAASRKIVERTL